MWDHMFTLTLPLAEKILRPTIVYVFIVVMLRIFGKRELAQLNPFDLVVLLTLSNTVQNAIIGEDNTVTGGVIGAATLLIVNYAVVRFLFTHQKLKHLIEGDPDVLMDCGVIKEDRLKEELLTIEELQTAAHRQGFKSLDECERAVIEPGGTIFFVRKEPAPDEVKQARLMARLAAAREHLSEPRRAELAAMSKRDAIFSRRKTEV